MLCTRVLLTHYWLAPLSPAALCPSSPSTPSAPLLPQNVFSQVYNTFLSRYGNNPPTGWEASCNWTAAAVGCQQNYGWGEWTGMNQALQINFTCGSNVLGMIADVNYNGNYVNVRRCCTVPRCAALCCVVWMAATVASFRT